MYSRNVVLLVVLAIALVGILPALGAGTPQPGPYDIHPAFSAQVGQPEPGVPGTDFADSTYGESPPDPPHYVAVGETIHFVDCSQDWDVLADGQGSEAIDWINQRWWHVDGVQRKYTNQQSDYAFDWPVASPGQFIVKEKVEDNPPVVTKDDTFLWWCSMKLYALGLEYIFLEPGSGGTVEDNSILIDIGSGSHASITGHGYNYTYTGGNRDGLRCYDDLGRVIHDQYGQPLPQDDVAIAAAYDWSFFPTQLGHVDLPSNSTWTYLYHNDMTGTGVITATYTKQTPNVTVCVPVKFVNGDYFIDLTGINYDEVQNVPINGKAPANRDGTGNVGQMKAKVIIEGAPSTSYAIEITDDSAKLDIVGAPTSLTTNGEGKAEQEFEIHAVGTEPSASTEEITMTASMHPDMGYDLLASTEEKLCVYKFSFHADWGAAPNDSMGDEFALWKGPPADVIMAWQITSAPGARTAAVIAHKYETSIRTQPGGAWSGEVSACMRVTVEDVCLLVQICKAWPPPTQTPPLGITFWILSIDIPGIPLGSKAGGFGGGDISITLAGDEGQRGDHWFDATEVPIPVRGSIEGRDFYWTFETLRKTDEPRTYLVGQVYPDLVKVKGAVGSQMEVRHVTWVEAPVPGMDGYYDDNGVDVIGAAMNWGLEPSTSYPGRVTIEEDDDVFEIQ